MRGIAVTAGEEKGFQREVELKEGLLLLIEACGMLNKGTGSKEYLQYSTYLLHEWPSQ